jgi:hypothetical protein
MPPSSNAFKAAEDAKAMQIDTEDTAKTIQIRAGLNPKYESELVNFLRRNKDIFVWSLVEMSVISREVSEHTLNIKPGSRPVKQGMQRFNQKRTEPWAKNYLGFWPLASLGRSNTQTG